MKITEDDLVSVYAVSLLLKPEMAKVLFLPSRIQSSERINTANRDENWTMILKDFKSCICTRFIS